jgi:hypothetical protein
VESSQPFTQNNRYSMNPLEMDVKNKPDYDSPLYSIALLAASTKSGGGSSSSLPILEVVVNIRSISLTSVFP